MASVVQDEAPAPDPMPSLISQAATELFPSQYSVPCPESCQKWLHLQPADLLRLPVHAQRHLPKSCTHLVANVLAWLCSLIHNPQLSVAQREAALLLLLLSPRWLWPNPPRRGAAPLPAHARPHLIRQRARLLTSGDWNALLDLLLQPAPRTSHLQPQHPDVLTPATAKGLLQAGQQHRLSTFWRRLHSYGVLPPSPATTAKVSAKWSQQHQMPAPASADLLSQTEVGELFPLELFDSAQRRLHSGTSQDAMGWYAETFSTLGRDPRLRRSFHALLQGYLSGQLGTTAWDLFNASSLILSKDAEGSGVRPIAMPSIWRKMAGLMILQKWRLPLMRAMGPHQYGAMKSDGGLQFATTIPARLDSAQAPLVIVRCDVQNAFGAVHRQQVLAAASQVDPLLSKSLAPWLCRSSGAALLSEPLVRDFLQTTRGIPQGDPLSSVLFSLTLSTALTCLDATPSRPALGTLDAYADDAILCTSPANAGPAFSRWRDRLADLGLELNPTKTAVWQPGATTLPASLCPFLPESCFSASGITLCGLPLDASTDPLHLDVPLGDASFLERLLAHQLLVLHKRLSLLEPFVDFHGPASPALHIALTLLRCNIQHSWAYLWRFLPPPTAQPHATKLDALLMSHFTRLTAILPAYL